MRPAPSPLPLLRVVTAIMALLAMLFTAHLLWQRHVSDLSIQSRYLDTELRDRLMSGLQWLEASVQPGAADDQPAGCPPKTDAPDGQKKSKLHCARAVLNAKLASARSPHHIPAELSDDSFPENTLKTMQWLPRNAHDGNHALSLIRNPEQTARQNTLADPFRLAGCLLASPQKLAPSAKTSACPGGGVVAASDMPPHMQSLLYPIHQYRAATRGASPNTLHWEPIVGAETPLTQGRHVTVAWSAQIQDQAQITVSCYAGDSNACHRCKWCNTEKSAEMFEAARVRAMGILIVDVKTGAVDASASAYTRCYAAHQRGEPATADCPLFPSAANGKTSERSFRLGNQALLQTAMPGSQVKVPIALGLMQASLSPTEAAALPGILTRSATEELIDVVLCKVRDFLPSCAHHRLSSIKRMARSMGWQTQTDILTLGQVKDLSSFQFAGRLMQLPPRNSDAGTIPALNQYAMRQCGLKPVRERWRNCHGADLVNIVAELFGQGNALASPIGIADGLLQLAAAGNGQRESSSAHLLATVQDSVGLTRRIHESRPLAFSSASAAPVLAGLSRTHSVGTARSACLAARTTVNGVGWAIPCALKASRDREPTPIRIASKTGTPVFSADKLTLPQWRESCAQVVNELGVTKTGHKRWYHLRNELAKCQMTPTKWYAMLVGPPGTKTWDKVVVVIAERNWNRATQTVDSARDLDANVAAEAGLALVNTLYSRALREMPIETL